jgi:diguanylate cyclase (GGDEF)-like protein/PAS domain S-box-containing protein
MTGGSRTDPADVLRRVVEMAGIGYGLADAGGTITSANPRLAEILGRADLVGLMLGELGLGAAFLPPASPESDSGDGAAPRVDPGPDERLIQRPDGRRAWTLIERSELTDEPATSAAFMFTLSDIDSLKRAQADAVQNVTEPHAEAQRIRHLALHDPLTGLANRTRFAQLVTETAARTESQRGHVAVLFLDLDEFKLVNDALGHLAGDELVRAVAQRFNAAVDEPATVVRFSGDKFVVFCTEIYRVEDAEEVARRLLRCLRTPFTVGDSHVFVTASVGISLSAEPQADRMLREADAAMYRAKALGPDRIAVFEPTLYDRSSRDLQLAAQMYEALADEQFVLDYQPIVELATGRIAGLEALVRWEHPTEGRLPPSEFVLIAQRTGMIAPLGGWILRRACADAGVWQHTYPEVAVHVNLSPSQLVDTLADEVGAALQASGLASERLVLEVTEAAMTPDPTEVDVPGALRGLGVAIALDHFGTGSSCLAFLGRLPLNELKIDRQFVGQLGNSNAGVAVVSTILRLAETFGLRAIAEGIETEAQLQALLTLGCKFGQGFHLSRPISPDRVGGLLATHG